MEQPNGHASPQTSPDQGAVERPLLPQLEQLGESLVVADLPSDPRKVLGALCYYIQTGSLEPPAPPTPVEDQRAVHESESENLRLQQRIRELEAAQSDVAAPAGAAPAAPAAPAPPIAPGQTFSVAPAPPAAAVPAADPAQPAAAPPAAVVPPTPPVAGA